MPSPINPPSGCRFHTRCPYVFNRCRVEEPLAHGPGARAAGCLPPSPSCRERGWVVPKFEFRRSTRSRLSHRTSASGKSSLIKGSGAGAKILKFSALIFLRSEDAVQIKNPNAFVQPLTLFERRRGRCRTAAHRPLLQFSSLLIIINHFHYRCRDGLPRCILGCSRLSCKKWVFFKIIPRTPKLIFQGGSWKTETIDHDSVPNTPRQLL